MMSELLALAERCEAATGPDRELDIEMLPLVGLRFVNEGSPFGRVCYDSNNHAVPMPAFTASLDAAMMLVPNRYQWSICNYDHVYGGGTGEGHAWLTPMGRVSQMGRDISNIRAATPALALCAAALRAKGSL